MKTYAEIEAEEDEARITQGVTAVLRAREESSRFVPTTSFLQRRLRLGYAQARRIVEEVRRRADKEALLKREIQG